MSSAEDESGRVCSRSFLGRDDSLGYKGGKKGLSRSMHGNVPSRSGLNVDRYRDVERKRAKYPGNM